MERWGLPGLAEPELELGGMAELGEGTGRPEQGWGARLSALSSPSARVAEKRLCGWSC